MGADAAALRPGAGARAPTPWSRWRASSASRPWPPRCSCGGRRSPRSSLSFIPFPGRLDHLPAAPADATAPPIFLDARCSRSSDVLSTAADDPRSSSPEWRRRGPDRECWLPDAARGRRRARCWTGRTGASRRRRARASGSSGTTRTRACTVKGSCLTLLRITSDPLRVLEEPSCWTRSTASSGCSRTDAVATAQPPKNRESRRTSSRRPQQEHQAAGALAGEGARTSTSPTRRSGGGQSRVTSFSGVAQRGGPRSRAPRTARSRPRTTCRVDSSWTADYVQVPTDDQAAQPVAGQTIPRTSRPRDWRCCRRTACSSPPGARRTATRRSPTSWNASFFDPRLVRWRDVYDQARKITQGATTPYEAAVALIESYFQKNFTYDEKADYSTAPERPAALLLPGRQERLLPDVLRHHDHDPAHARHPGPDRGGLHARHARRPPRHVVVTDRDAHAWVEVCFPQFGWLPFEPTPTPRAPVRLLDDVDELRHRGGRFAEGRVRVRRPAHPAPGEAGRDAVQPWRASRPRRRAQPARGRRRLAAWPAPAGTRASSPGS